MLEAGESHVVDVPLAARWFATWDGAWMDEPGEYVLRAGWSVLNLPLELVRMR